MAQIVLTFLMKKFFLLNDDENAMNWLGRMVSWALDVDVQNSSKPQNLISQPYSAIPQSERELEIYYFQVFKFDKARSGNKF
jgi:hypothetical protein